MDVSFQTDGQFVFPPWAEDRCTILIIFLELAVIYAYTLGDSLFQLEVGSLMNLLGKQGGHE